MKKYELTVVLDGKATPAKKKNITQKIQKLIETLKGKILKEEDWGQKELAGKIGKSGTGIYLHYEVELDAKGAGSINDKLRIEEEIIRHLLVKS